MHTHLPKGEKELFLPYGRIKVRGEV